jgi:hypothetical protein
MTTTNFNLDALKNITLSECNAKAYTVKIVLHSPTQTIEKTIYAENIQEALFDAAEMAKDWKANDRYFWHAYLIDGDTLIKRF